MGGDESPAVKWHWFLPTSGDGRNVTNVIDTVGQTAVTREADVEYLAEVLAGERVRVRCALDAEGALACEMTHAETGRVLARALTRWAPTSTRSHPGA